jgi:putative ABC transport system permease protein
VVGIFKTTDDGGLTGDIALMNYTYLEESRHTGRGTVGAYFIRVADVTRGIAVAQAVDRLFANSSNETRTESLREVAQSQLQSLGDLNFVVRAIVGAVLFALIFSTSAMMMQSIRERTGALAVMKTLGFSDNHLFWIVLAEAVTLCVVAATIGIVLAAWILPMARDAVRLEVRMPETIALVGIAIAAVVGIATAIGPAWRAQRLVVVQALADVEH